ncbi:hypothetical protein DL767_000642 [Monosporascus sp. MG133]|nr:hypothetical protein DL767_000642 [Monosporascus sp. MG133]
MPRDTTAVAPSYPVLQDSAVYPDAQMFPPFRFAEQRRDETVEYVKGADKAFVTTGDEYLVFGHGRSACPGRFLRRMSRS